MDTIFNELRMQLLELIDLISIKIDVSYILEELEEIEYKVRKLDVSNIGLGEEIKKTREKLYNQYKNKLAEFLPDKRAEKLIEQIKSWLRVIPTLY